MTADERVGTAVDHGRTDPDADADRGLFGPGSVTWKAHMEPILWVAGLRALFLQSLDPRVMRGTYQNSALFDRAKAWARFERTAEFVAVRTFAPRAQVESAAQRVRAIHAKLTGYDPDTGTTFPLNEPAGLWWVHCAEVDSYVDVSYRAGILDRAEADRYVAESVRLAELVGLPADEAPDSRAALAAYFARVRPRLYACAEAREALLRSLAPPLPPRLLLLRPVVPGFAALAFATLPGWARRMYGVPSLPGSELTTTLALRALRRPIAAALSLEQAPDVVQRASQIKAAAAEHTRPSAAPSRS